WVIHSLSGCCLCCPAGQGGLSGPKAYQPTFSVGNTNCSPPTPHSSTGSGWKFPFQILRTRARGGKQNFLKKRLTRGTGSVKIASVAASVAHLVERHLAKVEVASSSLVTRSKKEGHPIGCPSFLGFGRCR